MISKLLNILRLGTKAITSNNNLLFIGVLVFVFPLLFVLITQSFFDTAQANIETSEKRRVGILHDSLAGILTFSNISTEKLQELIELQAKQNPDITEIRLTEKTDEGFFITHSLKSENIGTFEKETGVYEAAINASENSFIFEFFLNNNRVWQVVRSVETEDSGRVYLFTQHSFETIDAIMQARMQQSYLGLTAIFIFLMALAYWFVKQINWKNRYQLLQSKLAERDLFSAMITHEFRAPLTVINGYVSFLKESKTIHPAEKRFVINIQSATERLLALVNDFLEVSSIQAGTLVIEKSNVDIKNVLQEIIDSNQHAADIKELTLTANFPKTPILHNTDTKRLQQVVQNILSNSLKYTQEGSVEVMCEQTSLLTIIRIKDTGTGISASDQQKLFLPFSRVGDASNMKIAGTGLGMWITKQMVELLGGTITIESIKDVGTHVVVSLKR